MKKQSKGILRIGTSGIVVPGSRDTFPAEFKAGSRLTYYGSLFNTLEVNSTFKKIPRFSTLERWSLEVPENFKFTLKLWRDITHVKELNFAPNSIDVFMNAAPYIGHKKGCLLVQFPGSITNKYFEQVEHILLRLQQLDLEHQWRKAIEFRSTTWYVSETDDLLNRYRASMVLQDMPKSNNLALNVLGKFIYMRFHGPKGDYRGSYSDDFLKEQAEKIRAWLSNGKDVYAYFNNTMGNAYDNAMSLKALVENTI